MELNPVCVRMKLDRLPDCLNPFPHMSHLNRDGLVCASICLFRLDEFEYPFPHSSHLNGVDPICVCI